MDSLINLFARDPWKWLTVFFIIVGLDLERFSWLLGMAFILAGLYCSRQLVAERRAAKSREGDLA